MKTGQMDANMTSQLLQTILTLVLISNAASDVIEGAASPTTIGPIHDYGSEYDVISKWCTPGSCRNGQCYVIGRSVRCYCQSLFKGARCEHVDLSHVTFAAIGSVVVFQWPRPPRLQGYSFVYYQLDVADSYPLETVINMGDNDRVALVGSLRGGRATYRVCVEQEDVARRVVSEGRTDYLSNCMSLTTEPDYHTLVAWVIMAALACVAVLLIYSQKDKLELLYFSKPIVIMFDQLDIDKLTSQNSGL